MNNNLIITHKDGRTWNEGQLGDLLRDEFYVTNTLCTDLEYIGAAWKIRVLSSTRMVVYVALDPSLYTVSPVGMIAVEKVRELVEEFRSEMEESHQTVPSEDYGLGVLYARRCITTIASKYLGGEN